MTTIPATRSFSIPRSVRVAFVIGRFEARKALRNPLIIMAMLAAVTYAVWQTWSRMPVLNRHDAVAAESLVPLAVTLLIVANMAAIRAHRHNTTELFDGMVTSAPTRTAGHLISVMMVTGLATVLLIVQLGYMKLLGGVTTPRLEVVLLGPAVVAFGGAFGIALGRWAPHLFVAPLGLAGLVAFSTAVGTDSYGSEREWLSLWVANNTSWTVTEATLRPYGWRLVYLLGLMALAAAAAFIPHPRPRRIAVGVTVIAFAAAALAGARQMDGLSEADQAGLVSQLLAGYEKPNCHEYADVSYCPMPGYEPWIDRWRKPTEGVLAAVPAEARPTDLRFLQAIGLSEMYDDERNSDVIRSLMRERRRGVLALENDVLPTLNWGRNADAEQNELDVALAVAARAVAVDHHFRLTQPEVREIKAQSNGRLKLKAGRLYRYCSTLEQGRAIVALWLAAQATDGSESAFQDAAADSLFRPTPSQGPNDFGYQTTAWGLDSSRTFGTSSMTWGVREVTYADALLRSDQGSVRVLIARNWDELTDPRTTTDEAAAILGLTLLPSLEEAFKNWHPHRPYRGVLAYGTPQCH